MNAGYRREGQREHSNSETLLLTIRISIQGRDNVVLALGDRFGGPPGRLVVC